ncbi:hypothetical protein EV668_4970, partial [Enterovirga rhinocerotis]
MRSRIGNLGPVVAVGVAAVLAIIIRGISGLVSDSHEGRKGAAQPAEAKQSAGNPQAAAKQPGRGRDAETPADIPATGWKDIAWRVYEEIGRDRVTAVAAGVTFYLLLAAFPAVAAFVSLYGLIADP